MKSLSAIAHSFNDTLLARAADVVLKERRKLVLVVRETPLHLGHLRLMAEVTEYGAIILPPVPSFYHRPNTIDDIVAHTVGKILDQFGLEHDLFRRWDGGPCFSERNHAPAATMSQDELRDRVAAYLASHHTMTVATLRPAGLRRLIRAGRRAVERGGACGRTSPCGQRVLRG